MENRVKRFVAFLVAVTAVIVLVPTAASAKTGTLTGLYNERYCEIFAVTMPDPPAFSVDVYNTVGLSDCPAEEWNAVDFTAVKEETGSLLAVPNGPRRWLIDTIANGQPASSSSERRDARAADHGALDAPLGTRRRVSSKDTLDELADAKNPLVPALRTWVHSLTLTRVL